MAKTKRKCTIDRNHGTFKGACVLAAFRDYNKGDCKVIENGKRRNCTDEDLIIQQGFPLSFKFSEGKTQRHRELGESVPPKAAKKLAEDIRRQL